MGSSGGGYYPVDTQVVRAEETVTPAVSRQLVGNTESAQIHQAANRSRLRGIRSTYNRFAQDDSNTNGMATKLG